MITARHSLLPVILFLLLAGMVMALGLSSSRRGHAAGIPASLNFPSVNCGGTTGTAKFSWTPSPDASQQWLDISTTDSGFGPGSFAGINVALETSSYTVPGLPSSTAHFWRVNSLTPIGWATSATGAFVPCGNPALLYSSVGCENALRAVLDFRWAPTGVGVAQQWIDLGYDPEFSPGSFINAGPLQPSAQSYRWGAIPADVRTFFRVNELGLDGAWHTSSVGEFTADCAPRINPYIYGSGDYLVMQRLGIKAPVNVRDVDASGYLDDPAGPTDVVRYNFPVFPNLGGYPGSGGTSVIAGHLDFRNYGYAVFAPLRDAVVGDLVTYYRADGLIVNYSVDWVADLAPDYSWAALAAATSVDSLVLVTCNGTFNFTTREYDYRRVVHAVLIVN